MFVRLLSKKVSHRCQSTQHDAFPRPVYRQEVKKENNKRSIVILWSQIWQMVDVTTSVKLLRNCAGRSCYSNWMFNWYQLLVAGQPQTVEGSQKAQERCLKHCQFLDWDFLQHRIPTSSFKRCYRDFILPFLFDVSSMQTVFAESDHSQIMLIFSHVTNYWESDGQYLKIYWVCCQNDECLVNILLMVSLCYCLTSY